MKTYVAKDRLHLVGKAWEVRYRLRLMLQRMPEIPLAATLVNRALTEKKPSREGFSDRVY